MTGPLYSVDEVYALLPALHRARDEGEGGVLRELVEVITEQVNVLAESLEQLYDDQFVETCAEWVAPYIGDLIGYRTLHGSVPGVASPRAEVANTIRYRRRKGTASMLEQLAHDVTAWPARVVEMFELLATTQYMNHLRPQARATADLRGAVPLTLGAPFQAGAFDALAHTAEVRRVATSTGRYNIPNISIFLWRVEARRLARSPLVPADASGRRYRLDPLGADRPLYAAARTEVEIAHLAEPFDVPLPLTRRWCAAHLDAYYGEGRSLLLETQAPGGLEIERDTDVRICDLSDDPVQPGAWIHEPTPTDAHVALDPVLGRVAFPTAPVPGAVRVGTFHHGSALRVGGGDYDRARSLGPAPGAHQVAGGQDLAPSLAAVAGGGVVEILDDDRYVAPSSIVASGSTSSAAGSVVLRAVDGVRPLLVGDTQIDLTIGPDATLELNGLVLAGAPLVIAESGDARLRTLVLRHCTLVPGLTRTVGGLPGSVGCASLVVLDPFTTVVLDHCIVGPVVLVDGAELRASSSVIDASARAEVAVCGRASIGGAPRSVTSPDDRRTGDGLTPSGMVSLDACTVIGKVHVEQFDVVSNSLLLAERSGPGDPWVAPVWAERRQVGCVRFSYLSDGARTPRRYRCVPRDGVAPSVAPHHTSLRYGDAGYAQLRRTTPCEVRTGASDESEMGVGHDLYQPQRETNLRLRLDEYLRFGLEAGIFYAT